jgi:8-oxo-dGTP diphosphatase
LTQAADASGAKDSRPLIDVAVGMLRAADGAVLMSSRPAGKPYPGYWEFPGGKVESGEPVVNALGRELMEEINVRVLDSVFAWHAEHAYTHLNVRLHFYWVTRWQGEPQAQEAQQTRWIGPRDAWPYPILPATLPFLDRIRSYRD